MCNKWQKEHIYYRYFTSFAYREYIQTVYRYLGKQRISLPACAYDAIRQRFVGKILRVLKMKMMRMKIKP